MSFHWCDNLHTTVFTPRDYQVELLASAFERNTLICLGHKSSKEFIALKLLQEMSRQMHNTKKKKISIYLTNNENAGIDSMIVMLQHLTDLKVFRHGNNDDMLISDWPDNSEVYVLHPRICLAALQVEAIKKEEIHLMILDDCHEMLMYSQILPIMTALFNTTKHAFRPPKILGLGGPLHSANCTWHELSAMLKVLEENIHCKAETASDIVTVLRYCSKPIEYIVQCAPYCKDDLTLLLEDIISTRMAFLNNHRYDPTEIYNTDEFLEELKDIPDPKKEPLEYLNIVQTVLREMGPWCADRVALNFYHRIEKQKIKTPHERHFILLCLVNTAFAQIHTICEQTFRQIIDHKQLVEKYSSPKVLRLLEILRMFKPEEFRMTNDNMKSMHNALDNMDFQKVTRAIEQSCQSVEHIAKQQIASQSIVENLDPIVKRSSSELSSDYARTAYYANVNAPKTEHTHRSRGGSNNNQPGRGRRRVFIRRHMRQQHDANDTLCAIIFCNTNHTARVLYDLLAEMSRHDADLHYLKCQFIADRVADPVTEPKEAENEHRRQEDVLKKFRMHDCNVLVGTSVLEEGIDVPKCNLVVRWDKPNTYRSYVQCKGRARATPAYHIILVSPHSSHDDEKQQQQENKYEHQAELLSKRSHKYICQLPAHENDANGQHVHSDFCNTTEDEEEPDEDNHLKRYTRTSSKGTVKILNPEVIRYKSAKQINTQVLPTATRMITAGDGTDECMETVKPIVDVNACESEISIEEIKTDEEEKATNDIINTSRVPTILLETNNESLTNCFEMFELNESLANLSLNDTATTNVQEKQSATTVHQLTSDSNSTKMQGNSKKIKNKIKRQPKCYICDKNEQHKEPIGRSSFELELEQMEKNTCAIVNQLAQYQDIEKMLLKKCANVEPTEAEHQHADQFTRCIKFYKPLSDLLTAAFVDMSNAIALVNKYCSKLPSDTFTKLTALWRCAKTIRNGVDMYQYTIRLPINSPLKYDIVGLPMPTNVLARRIAALKACIELHKCGELDNYLQPIGKEGFKAIESDWENFELEAEDEQIVQNNCEPRPGTTKRRQYYYKRIASEFCDCRPTANTPSYLYLLDLTLQCPIPEEQNTRGRKIYPPEDAQQGFGILTLKKIPKVSSFPIFTRSGEVKVSIELAAEPVILSEKQIHCINIFVNYTFTNVLRLQKFLMLFDPDSTENCIFIVPTIKTPNGKTIDWNFLNLIERNASKMPTCVSEEERKNQEFDAQKFKDAVVMPWYRNQDQPQYFYVAEICPNLTPLSCFPGETYNTFKHYYFLKYGLNIQNTQQPLLDVDHTSARLNFLTPRYVNRKGVALPTSSEETKRAKRENLEQKQILVPELCTVHPFPASLWRTAVCLPCILYRINGLLLADDIRKKVSADIGLGKQQVNDAFEWPMLDFGWSLSEVLRKSKEIKIQNKIKDTTAELNPSKSHEMQNSKKKESKNEHQKNEKSANEIIMEGEQKLLSSGLVEIGTWSNEMADDINMYDSYDSYDDDDDDDERLNYLPPNVSFCDPKTRYGSPTFWDVKKSSELKTDSGHTTKETINNNWYDNDEAMGGTQDAAAFNESNWYSDDDDDDDDDYYDDEDVMENDGMLHISFNSKHEAETLETEQDIEKRKRQLSIIQATNANERNYQETKNLQIGYNFEKLKSRMQQKLQASRRDFDESTSALRKQIENSNMLVKYNENMHLMRKDDAVSKTAITAPPQPVSHHTLQELLPYVPSNKLQNFIQLCSNLKDQASLSLEQIEDLNHTYVGEHKEERFTILSCGDIFDNFNDKHSLEIENDEFGVQVKKLVKINFHNENNKFNKKTNKQLTNRSTNNMTNGYDDNSDKYTANRKPFSFSDQPELLDHPGPSPSIILQALTMSNANDGINLERLETIGDSFLKYAITTYLYITYENVHEGKLSHLRSKQVANLNLYRLGRRKMLGEYMIATKFEPHDNWLPPCYYVPKQLEKALIEAKIPPHHWKYADLQNIKKLSSTEICALVREKADELELDKEYNKEERTVDSYDGNIPADNFTCFIPYNLVTQHSIPDKSVADCVEALIGAYLIECGTRGALLFMAWLGIRVLPFERKLYNAEEPRVPGSTCPDADNMITVYGEWSPPSSPLLHYTPHAEEELQTMLEGFDAFEKILGYKFRDRSYLLQAMTHASYSPNRLTDCYQRLEFLGDAVLDYLITRHLYEDPRQHSPGALTDLRSALVNNTIFASLAVRHGFHKYFRHLSPGLNDVIDRFVRIQNENGHCISEEYYLLSEEECDDAEDVEVPKALGDVFESIAGAIFLDSNMSLDTVWKVYSNMMKPEIEQFSNSVPKSPIRELLELEPETAKFGKPEKLADGRRVRVTVDVFCKGTFRGIGRNYRIAKCTAAKCALRQLKKQGLISKKD